MWIRHFWTSSSLSFLIPGSFSVFDFICGSRTIFVEACCFFSSCNDQYSGYHYNRACQQLRDRKSNFWQQQLIGSKSFDPESAQDHTPRDTIKEWLPHSEFLNACRLQQHDDQHHQTPQGFVQVCRMNLNIHDSFDCLGMIPHLCCDVRTSYRIHRKSHSKQSIRIFPKGFSVEEVPPSSDHLSGDQTKSAGVK